MPVRWVVAEPLSVVRKGNGWEMKVDSKVGFT